MNDLEYAGGSVAAGTRNFADQAILYAQVWGPRILAALVILLIGWRIGVPAAGLQAGLAVFTLMSLIGTARVKPREALDPMTPPERLAAGFGLYAAIAIHGYAIVYATDAFFH